MLPRVLCRRRLDFFLGFFAVILGGYFFCVASKIRPTLFDLVLDDAYRQVSEAFGELGPEGLQHYDHEGGYDNEQFLGRLTAFYFFKK